jgi:histidine triad (HIT) family protein
MKNCNFCKILKGEIEASFVLKSENVSAFMDINPINKSHVLIVPNDHHERFSSVKTSVVGEMFKVAQSCLKAIEMTDIACEVDD